MAVRSEYPEATIVIEHGSYDEILDDLRSGRIDMLYGVLRLPAWVHDATEEPLFENPYVIAVGRDHPLTRVKRLSLEHLARHDWIASKPGTPRRRCLQRMFERAACSPRIAVETSSLHVQRALLTSSDRITLLTRQEMEQEASLGSLVTLPYLPPKTRAQDGLATRSDWQPTAIQARFLELLRLHRPRSDTTVSARAAGLCRLSKSGSRKAVINPSQTKALVGHDLPSKSTRLWTEMSNFEATRTLSIDQSATIAFANCAPITLFGS